MNWNKIKEKYPKAMGILRDTKHYDMAEPISTKKTKRIS